MSISLKYAAKTTALFSYAVSLPSLPFLPIFSTTTLCLLPSSFPSTFLLFLSSPPYFPLLSRLFPFNSFHFPSPSYNSPFPSALPLPAPLFSLPLIFHFSPASQHPPFIYNNYSPALTLSVSSPFSSPERVGGVNTACFQCRLSFGYCYGFQFHCSVCVGRPISTKYSVYNVQCSVVHRFSRPTGWVGSGWIFSGLMWVLVYYACNLYQTVRFVNLQFGASLVM